MIATSKTGCIYSADNIYPAERTGKADAMAGERRTNIVHVGPARSTAMPVAAGQVLSSVDAQSSTLKLDPAKAALAAVAATPSSDSSSQRIQSSHTSIAYMDNARTGPTPKPFAKPHPVPVAETSPYISVRGEDAVGPNPSGSSPLHAWPIIFAIAPPLLKYLVGDATIWGEMLAMALVIFYLYMLLKVPWELYSSARSAAGQAESSYFAHASTKIHCPGIDNARHSTNPNNDGVAARAELKTVENKLLVLFVVSPLIGGVSLHVARKYIIPAASISEFHIILFTLAAMVKPFLHVISLIRDRTAILKGTIAFPSNGLDALHSRLSKLNAEILELNQILGAQSRENKACKDSIDAVSRTLNHSIVRLERKQTLDARSSEDRLSIFESAINELGNTVELFADMHSRGIPPMDSGVHCASADLDEARPCMHPQVPDQELRLLSSRMSNSGFPKSCRHPVSPSPSQPESLTTVAPSLNLSMEESAPTLLMEITDSISRCTRYFSNMIPYTMLSAICSVGTICIQCVLIPFHILRYLWNTAKLCFGVVVTLVFRKSTQRSGPSKR
ncbi:hypothetical protein BASA82_001153 [Batrachochytrium salamandrivorans]|nr:hypothetical protein BASA61_000764 [Batrachochytrium salamandrivorans]KAH9260492.1 hypothetical protein BASA82_001153 [Batrachochytrium salamandrivorans]